MVLMGVKTSMKFCMRLSMLMKVEISDLEFTHRKSLKSSVGVSYSKNPRLRSGNPVWVTPPPFNRRVAPIVHDTTLVSGMSSVLWLHTRGSRSEMGGGMFYTNC